MFDPAFAPFVWLVGGLALCAAELVVPGAFLLWVGFAAVTLGLVELILPIPFEWSLLVAAALAVAYCLVGRKVYGGLETGGDDTLNRRAENLVGRDFTLIEPIVPPPVTSTVLPDSIWRVSGADAPAGARIRVTGVTASGSVLTVEAA